jgi:hypothetical protein
LRCRAAVATALPITAVTAISIAAIHGRRRLDCGLRRRGAAAVAAVSAAIEAAFTALLLRLMAQFGLRPVLHLGRDAGLADTVRVRLGADRRNGSGRSQKGQGSGRDRKSAHVASPWKWPEGNQRKPVGFPLLQPAFMVKA